MGLKPGGIYIVEDVEINYWIQGVTYGLNASIGRDPITKFKQLVDVVNHELNLGCISLFGVALYSRVETLFFASLLRKSERDFCIEHTDFKRA